MNAHEPAPRRVSLASGIALIAIGGLFLIDTLELAHFGPLIRDYWPMIVIAAGVAKFFEGRPASAIWMIVIGLWLQVSHLGLFGLDWSSSWPILLILVGGGMVLQAIGDAVMRRGGRKGDHHAPQG